ncbi:MAG TPA: CehA/McbA family metallohydrolase [Gemmatimonadales bacterium]|nr:CehA/McbA family metallohydrolase [Gemmatimonadales bacterium]
MMQGVHLRSFACIRGLWFLLLPAAAVAQRQPVLPQIKVPHPYYYREMYLPQAMSGPGSLTWSPDGTEIIYSMQGTLWRQKVGGTTAIQLTDGPGYDYQPDWSPDGKTIVFTRYDGKALSLWTLDLSTGESVAIVDNGAVNLDPRWSPDGSRIAFVSTAYEGRWHIYLTDRSGRPPLRISGDRDSGLPRYYYSRFDHFLSPAWSPDGMELLVLSNMGHIWGTGALWRMSANSEAEARLVHDEETNWRTRPDWSRDGKRIVYASYQGRQWHQLWVMTADGLNPFQLTYGEFDAVNPRWSPDGMRIGFVANEGGNTSLRIVTVPGGRVETVEAVDRQYFKPHSILTIRLFDAVTGKAIPARVSITGEDGRSWVPDDAWRHADDSFDPARRKMEYGYFHMKGAARISVPRGVYRYEISRGPEYAPVRGEVTLGSTPQVVTARLKRIANLPAAGWYSGDLHVHMNYGGWYRNTPAHLALQAKAEDLHLVEDLIVNKEGRIPDIELFTGKPDPVSDAETLILHDQEYHTSYWGHTGLLGLSDHIILPGYAAYTQTAAASLWPTNAEIHDQVKAQGGITGYVHPFDYDIDPADTAVALKNEFPVDLALGKIDYIEALGFVDDYMATAKIWYRALNCGFRLPTGAGTDAMANYASLRGPVGMDRVYVRTGAAGLNRKAYYAALVAGKSFATNGPLLDFSLGGQPIGGELKLPAGSHKVVARISLTSYVAVDHLEVVGNGQVVATLPLTGDRTRFSGTITLPVDKSGWYLLRARGDRDETPVLDVYPYATTSPIYVSVGGQPIRSPEDAAYFLAWTDRLIQGATTYPEFNSDAERAKVLGQLNAARAEWVEKSRKP